ncbi:MAG: single-stranded DNA-binding protein, partial [Acutalibacteraceae bacterium]|nr:single-stranded DNA-binding protein [Acutalibacteraceae bacterium]
MFNLVVLTGRLTADPELKTTPNGISVTSFSIAVDRRYRSGEERQTDFINIVAWRTSAEFICKYFKKGNLIGIEGSIQTRRYQDKNGNNR